MNLAEYNEMKELKLMVSDLWERVEHMQSELQKFKEEFEPVADRFAKVTGARRDK